MRPFTRPRQLVAVPPSPRLPESGNGLAKASVRRDKNSSYEPIAGGVPEYCVVDELGCCNWHFGFKKKIFKRVKNL